MSVTDEAQTICEQFANHEIDIEAEEIETQLEKLVNEYAVPIEEAQRSVTNSILEENDVDRGSFFQPSNDLVPVGEIDEEEKWVDVEVQVLELWTSNSDAISQVGLLGDASGKIKFVSFEKSDLPLLEEGKTYRLGNIVTDEYQGRYSVKLNRTTKIKQLDENVDVVDRGTTRRGAIVKIQPGSGLIKRCPDEDCTRVLRNGLCSEHGDREGEFDLRIKAVLDKGEATNNLLFDREQTETITGITLEEASRLAMDALSTDVVQQRIEKRLVGRYVEVEGPEIGRYLLVNEADIRGGPSDNEIATLDQ